ncbi:MAG: hypothetical protein ACTSPI_17335, partial [Candidatus Heimdallarchaeaceae archaeon]
FGSVLKSVATVRTSLNANLVELYALAAGPGDIPVLPSLGLKEGLVSYFDEIKVLTDELRVLDGGIKSVALDANVVIDRNADPATTKLNVEQAVSDFFGVNNFDLGEGLYLGNLYEVIQRIDGVKVVDIFAPTDNILSTGKIGSGADNEVGFNELITLGETRLRFYSEPSPQ